MPSPLRSLPRFAQVVSDYSPCALDNYSFTNMFPSLAGELLGKGPV